MDSVNDLIIECLFGAEMLDIWTFTIWCQQAGSLNVIRTNRISANLTQKLSGFRDSTVASLQSMFAKPVRVAA